VLAGCTPTADLDNLVGSETCRPPCWVEIDPEKTTVDGAINLLEERERRGEGELSLLESGIVRWRSTSERNVYLYSNKDGLISRIELDLRSGSIRLDDIVTLFGEPSNLDIGKIRDGYFVATLFYPKKGLAFVGSGNKFDVSDANTGFVIRADMVIVKGVYFRPSGIVEMVHLLYGEEAVSDALSDIQDWTGYGIYRER
jgi:hypothetical protein